MISKTLEDQDAQATDVQVTTALDRGARLGAPIRHPQPGDTVQPSPLGGIAQGTRTHVTIDNIYRLTYKGEKCGHQWVEKQVKTQRGQLPANLDYHD